MKKSIKFLYAAIASLASLFAFSCADGTVTLQSIPTPELAKLYDAVSNPTSQKKFDNYHCHDPKLFQDDDGTFYVYSTDASAGNVSYTGVIVRKSTDLVKWETLPHSAIQGYWDNDFLSWLGYSDTVRCDKDPQELKHNAEKDPFGTSYKVTNSKNEELSKVPTTWAPTVIKQNDLYYTWGGIFY